MCVYLRKKLLARARIDGRGALSAKNRVIKAAISVAFSNCLP